ncbi:MAG: STY4199 family HEPN domain-containing protein, partial [Planctomycetota bacterium]
METNKLIEITSRSFRDLVATLLTDERVPENLNKVVDLFKSRKSDLGRKELAAKIGLSVEELVEFERGLVELNRRSRTGIDEDANTQIACYRFLSWLESIADRKSEFQLDFEIDSSVPEDICRKQVRALELVIRSLVGERHNSQHHLSNHLRQIFGERTVERWAKVADPNDLLSGTTFSELASIFVNKDEFTHHQKLYEDADVINLLNERRKTAQSYLDDIRRVRNTLAHNKRVSNIQLSLLDLYYDQLISPIQTGFASGHTQVNPNQFLKASDSEVQSYFQDLRNDVMSVKDDVTELKLALAQQYGDIKAQGQELAATASGINLKAMIALALLIPIAAAVGYGIYLNRGTGEQISELTDTADYIQKSTDSISKNTDEIRQTADEISDKSDEIIGQQTNLSGQVDQLAMTASSTAENTESIKKNTDSISNKTDAIGKTTDAIASTTSQIAESAERMEKSNDKIIDTVSEIADSNQRIAQSIESIQDGFKTLTRSGGIIPDPKLPQEIYHNARMYEQRGDYANARKSYIKFFDFKLPLVDPHLR